MARFFGTVAPNTKQAGWFPRQIARGVLRVRSNLILSLAMATEAFEAALGRLEQALARVEGAVSAQGNRDGDTVEELALLKVRHRKLKDTVAQELRQLDLLLAGLPK